MRTTILSSVWTILILVNVVITAEAAKKKTDVVAARIGIVSPDKSVGLVFHDAVEGVRISQANWLGENHKDKRLDAITRVDEAWREFKFSFMPKRSGTIRLELMSDDREGWVEFKAVSEPGLWRAYRSATKRTENDEILFKVNHDNRVSRDIRVEKGQPVTLSCKVRLSDVEPRD